MSSSQPLYYIGPPGTVREACLATGGDVQTFNDASEFGADRDKAPGLVVLPADRSGEALALAAELWDAGPGWVVAVGSADPEPVFRTVSLGVPSPVEALAQHVACAPGAKLALVDLREALLQMARARHDVNNPLTAALAEVQILLLDSEEGSEDHEGLVVIEEQLRRIRDLVASTNHLHVARG